MKLGTHVSIAGTIDLAIDRAVTLGCNTFQIFVTSPRAWRANVISDHDVDLFKLKYKAAKMEDAFAHSIYLINLATRDDFIREKSIESLISGLVNVNRLGLLGLVTHIGSHQGDGVEAGIERTVDGINQILAGCDTKAMLLLENTAGAGNLVGKSLEELGQIVKKVDCDRVGICIDTAHAFEYGYEINTEKGLSKFLDDFEHLIGLEKLKAIHLNDSMTELGSNHDRHEEFGKGLIGEEAMIRIINHPKLRDLPFAMETPGLKKGLYGKEFVERIRSLEKD